MTPKLLGLLKRNSLASEVDYIPDLAFSNSAVVQVDGVEGGRNAFGIKKALSLSLSLIPQNLLVSISGFS